MHPFHFVVDRKLWFVVVLVVGTLLLGAIVVTAQGPRPAETLHATSLPGNGFTYQGQLLSSGAPVNGSCDLQFGLYDAPSGGSQLGITSTVGSVSVSRGLFTALLNAGNEFGDSAFTGDARWLLIAVSCPTGGAYTSLSPRQALTALPFALPGLRTFPNATSPNIVGGYGGNSITDGKVGSTIGGGGYSGYSNTITNSYAFIGGGYANIARGSASTVGGGSYNQANQYDATVGGGYSNQANGDFATVGGGYNNYANQYFATVGGGNGNQANGLAATVGGGNGNRANGGYATVGGGNSNVASGLNATVPGGVSNLAQGNYSFAAGRNARAQYDGSFVWADSTGGPFASTGNDQFLIRASGGVGIGTTGPLGALQVVTANDIDPATITSWDKRHFVVGNAGNNGGIGMSYDQTNNVGYIYSLSPSVAWRNLILQSGGGNVGIGIISPTYKLDVNGNVHASDGFNGQCLSAGSFTGSGGNACNMDVAESFASTALTEAGDLVVLSPDSHATPTVRKSAHAYEGLLVGVVSTNPGLVFDNGATHLAGDNSQLITSDKTVVALIGRVPVKVGLENGLIAVGDPLTSSSQPGIAMKATQPGKIIGYALESKNEPGKVLALVQPGYFLPSGELDARQQTTDLKTQNAELEQEIGTLEARMAALEQQNATTEARLAAIEQTLQNGNAPTLANTMTFSPEWFIVAGLIFAGLVLAQRSRSSSA